jgi:TolB-like protein/Tfp pilus assembly protein PilF
MASIIPGYEYDIFLSYRQKDNKYDGWVTEFVENLKRELEATFKDDISIYFDENPHDGLLESHSVDKSLANKLKCLVFIPVISQTYCDPKSFAWQHEFIAFNKMAKEDHSGRDIRLPGGNVASRILPIKIHDLDPEDKTLLENELEGVLRGIDFIYKSAGVNRPLRANEDHPQYNLNKTYYRDQINKVANSVKEIINALKGFDGNKEEASISTFNPGVTRRLKRARIRRFVVSLVIVVLIAGYFLFPKFKGDLQNNSPGILDKSIAVLPFENMSKDTDQQYFNDGLTEGILNALAHLKDFRVPAEASSFQFRGNKVDLHLVGKKLGVHMVLRGSVQRQRDTVRITVQLIDTENGFNIWSQQYTEREDDIFAVQDKIANSVAEKLEVTFLGNAHQINLKKPTQNKEAYELYLKGRFFWNLGSPPDLKKGISFFQQAIALDPIFAAAYSGLADCYTSLGYGFLAPKDAIPKAKKAAAKALELDSTLAEPHASVGFLTFYYDWNWAGAEKEFRTAIALNPNYALGYDWYGYYLTMMGKYDEARAILKKAKDLDPLSVKICTDMGFNFYYSGNFDQAIKELKACIEMNSKFAGAHAWLGRTYQAKKMYPEAIAEWRESLNSIPNWTVALAGIGNIYGEEGKKAEALKMLDTLNSLSTKQFVTSYGIALVYTGVGDKDKTFEWLNNAYEERSNWLVWLKHDPRWKSIRSDKRYADLIRKVGLPN